MVECDFLLQTGKTVKIELPLEWNEFDNTELSFIVKALNTNTPKPILALQLLEYRLQLNKVKGFGMHQLNADDLVNDLLPLIDYYLENINLTRNPVLKLGDFIGLDNFDNMLVGEYEEADINYILYNQEQDVKHLRALAQCLWRPRSKGKRISLEGYEYSGSFFDKLSANKLHLIYLWFTGCRNELLALFPDIFGRSDNEDEEVKNNQEQQSLGITDLVHSAAGERNGTRREIRWQTTIKEFLYDCQLQQAQHEEMMQKMKQNDS